MGIEPEPPRKLTSFQKALEAGSGMTFQQLQEADPVELRAKIERQFGAPAKLISEFPFTEGRGHE